MADRVHSSQGSSPPASPERPAPATGRFQPSVMRVLPLVLMVYASLIPMEARLTLSGQNVYPVRIVLYLLLPWIARQIFQGALRPRLPDYLVAAAATWMILSFCMYYGVKGGFLRGLALAFDIGVPYLVGRLTIRSLDDLRRVLVIVAPGFAIAGLSMAAESLTRAQIVRPLFEAMFRPLAAYENGIAVGDASQVQLYRFGLMRAQGPFPHPIIGGIYMASLLPLYAASGLRGWPKALGLLAGCCAVFSVSSAAFLVLLVVAALMIYELVQQRTTFLNWGIAISFGLLAVLMLEVVTESGAVPFLTRYALDPATASYRLLIWEFGTASIGNNPWFGIGFTDYERPYWMGASIDNQWLLLGVRHGLAAPFLVFAPAAIVIVMMANTLRRFGPADRRFALASIASFFALALAGFTVAFPGGFLAWFYALQGILAREPAGEAEKRPMRHPLAPPHHRPRLAAGDPPPRPEPV